MWTPITKPNSRSWVNENAIGRTQYSQADIAYDDSRVFYDGANPNRFSKVLKPTTETWIKVNKPS